MQPDNQNKKYVYAAPYQPKPEGGYRSLLATIALFLFAPLVALFLITFVFQSYQVDGPSMETTLQHNDRLIVLKLPKTWGNLTGKNYVPARGDIIIFERHESGGFSGETDKHLIKRVIGLPGDHVVIKDGKVTIFNEESSSGFNPDENQPYEKDFKRTTGNIDLSISDDEVFVLGDNRDNSLDSRVFGPVKLSNITGKLALRIYPFNKFDGF